MDLVRQYARSGSEQAFRAIVERYLNLVYSTALRKVHNPHQAEEVCQAVFIILARKAQSLPQRTVLAGWLYETARLTAANYLRAEIRRAQREQEAQMQTMLEPSEPEAWVQIAPVLDEAMADLNKRDRDAVVLRFFQTKSFQEVGASLGMGEAAAKMRVHRAIEKLRKFILRRGVTVSTVALGSVLTEHTVHAATAGMAASITAAALTTSVTQSSTFVLIKTTLKIMAWTKAKTIAAVGGAVLLAATTVTVTVKQIVDHRSYPWQVRSLSSDLLDRVPPQVRIVTTKFPKSGALWVSSSDKVIGIGQPIESILLMAYNQPSLARTILTTNLPAGKFDLIANLPQNSREALQREVKRQFGLSGSRRSYETNVLRLTVKHSGANGLRVSKSQGGSVSTGSGQFSCSSQPLSSLKSSLETQLQVPVVDETGLSGRFDIELNWDEGGSYEETLDSLNQALQETLGLELTPAKQTIEAIVIQ
jgi:uncharacterized protein (TIGR03435 family)